MNDDFIISINNKGNIEDYTAHLKLQGYAFKIVINITGTDVYFERDEEGSFRVVTMPEQDIQKLEKISKELLQLLADELEKILR